jgi:hypothetical protein
MKPTEHFSFLPNAGARDTWPLKTVLFANGAATSLKIPGNSLLRQFETINGYLIITDEDCPFEETTHFILLNHNLTKILSSRRVSAPYCSYQLASIEWADNNRFVAIFQESSDRWEFTIRNRGIPFLLPQLKMVRRWIRK